MHAVSATVAARSRRQTINILFLVALAVDLLTPTLIWWRILPAPVRWLSHAAIALMIAGSFARMLVADRVPGITWLMLGVSVFWGSLALLNGQGPLATAWGWWLLFQFPLAGLFAYLQPTWPERFPSMVLSFMLGVCALEAVFQAGQYLAGSLPGDAIGGTLGERGTGTLVVLLLLAVAVALGHWLSTSAWQPLAAILALGLVSSVLGEMKLYPFGVLLLGLASLAVDAISHRRLTRMIPAVATFTLVLAGFALVYDTVIVPLSPYNKPLAAFIDPEDRTLEAYLNVSIRVNASEYDLGRNYALRYAWDAISQDPLTLLFGEGLGARGESRTFNTAGVALQGGDLGRTSGTSLMVLLQELGVVGVALVGGLLGWILLGLAADIRRHPASPALPLRYGLALFSLLWPVLLWYNSAWTLRVPMLIYWVLLGYVLRERPQRRPSPPLRRAGQP